MTYQEETMAKNLKRMRELSTELAALIDAEGEVADQLQLPPEREIAGCTREADYIGDAVGGPAERARLRDWSLAQVLSAVDELEALAGLQLPDGPRVGQLAELVRKGVRGSFPGV